MKEKRRLPWEFHGEIFKVETPELTTVEYHIADFGTRIVAAMIDYLFISLLVLGLILLGLLTLAMGAEIFGFFSSFLIVAYFFIRTFYFVYYEVRLDGQTPGKRRFAIRTMSLSGRGLTLGPALVRNLARIVDEIPLLWIVPAFSNGKRRLGDLLAGTIVIDESREKPPKRARDRSRDINLTRPKREELGEPKYFFDSSRAAKLHVDDLNLLEFMEERLRNTLGRRRRQMLREVAEKYIARLEMEDDEERILADPLRFLQELGLFLRERFERQNF